MKIDRQAVYRKYDGHCAYCGREIKMKDMQVDHKIPKYDGGTDDMENLMPSCRLCNHYKRASSIREFRDKIATIPKKLGERNYIYKVGMAYGFWNSSPKKVKFYYELINEFLPKYEVEYEYKTIKTYDERM